MGGLTESQTLEINPQHEIIVLLNSTRKTNSQLAGEILAQVLDNAMFQSGIFENPIPMIKRLNRLLTQLLRAQQTSIETNKPQHAPEDTDKPQRD